MVQLFLHLQQPALSVLFVNGDLKNVNDTESVMVSLGFLAALP